MPLQRMHVTTDMLKLKFSFKLGQFNISVDEWWDLILLCSLEQSQQFIVNWNGTGVFVRVWERMVAYSLHLLVSLSESFSLRNLDGRWS